MVTLCSCTSNFQLDSFASQVPDYSPGENEQFIFIVKDESLQKYDYDRFGKTTKTSHPYRRLSYSKYVGKKGYFTTSEPVQNNAGYDFWPVILETGEKYYYISKESYGGKYNWNSPIIPLTQYMKTVNYSVNPLVEGSDIMVTGLTISYGKEIYLLSNGITIEANDLKIIRQITDHFRHNKERIAQLLLKTKIDKDDMENRYFIEPVGSILRSEVKLYIGLNSEKQWLRLKVKYYDDSWLFVKSFKIAADEYRWQSPDFEFKRDNSSGYVWEWIDISPSTEHIEIIRKLSSAQNSTIRFQGSKYYSDKPLEPDQKSSNLVLLELYQAMIAGRQ